MDKPTPHHLRLIDPATRWDWRRESPVEIVLLIFAAVFFLFLPRTGCGVSAEGMEREAAVEVDAVITTPRALVVPGVKP